MIAVTCKCLSYVICQTESNKSCNFTLQSDKVRCQTLTVTFLIASLKEIITRYLIGAGLILSMGAFKRPSTSNVFRADGA